MTGCTTVTVSDDARAYACEMIALVSDQKLQRIFEILFDVPVEISDEHGFVLDIPSEWIINQINHCACENLIPTDN